MFLRRLLALLIGLAMGLAPLAMPAAAAAPTSAHHSMMAAHGGHDAAMDHCGGKPGPGKPIDKNCCAATCLGLAVAPALAAQPPELAGAALHPAAVLLRTGISSELPTPPPRSG